MHRPSGAHTRLSALHKSKLLFDGSHLKVYPSACCAALIQVRDSTVPGAKDLDPMAAIPESHPVTEPPVSSHRYRSALSDRLSPTYSVTADCTHSPGTAAATTSAAASDMSHSFAQPAAAMAAPFMKRIRVTSKPKADISMVTQPTWHTSVRSGEQAVAADGPEAAATEQSAADVVAASNQQALLESGASAPAAAAADNGCSARDTDVRQMSHTPLYSFSQTFQHDIALTHSSWRGSGSPMPQRAISEQPSTSNAHQTSADSAGAIEPSTGLSHQAAEAYRCNSSLGITNSHMTADAACQNGKSLLTGQHQTENRSVAQSQQLSAQLQEPSAKPQQLSTQPQQLGAQPQALSTVSWLHCNSADEVGSSQQLAASGGTAGGSAGGSAGSFRGSSSWQLQREDSECRAGRGRAREQQSAESDRPDGSGMILNGDDDWCEVPASPRWWDNVAKTDVIGMKELQRYVTLSPSHLVAKSACLNDNHVTRYPTAKAAPLLTPSLVCSSCPLCLSVSRCYCSCFLVSAFEVASSRQGNFQSFATHQVINGQVFATALLCKWFGAVLWFMWRKLDVTAKLLC